MDYVKIPVSVFQSIFLAFSSVGFQPNMQDHHYAKNCTASFLFSRIP